MATESSTTAWVKLRNVFGEKTYILTTEWEVHSGMKTTHYHRRQTLTTDASKAQQWAKRYGVTVPTEMEA